MFLIVYSLYVCMQRSEEWMREMVGQLKIEVHHLVDAPNATMSAANTLTLVDALERLGIDHQFREEIDAALCRVHSEDIEFRSPDELHITALRFRLLRQHGFLVCTGIIEVKESNN